MRKGKHCLIQWTVERTGCYCWWMTTLINCTSSRCAVAVMIELGPRGRRGRVWRGYRWKGVDLIGQMVSWSMASWTELRDAFSLVQKQSMNGEPHFNGADRDFKCGFRVHDSKGLWSICVNISQLMNFISFSIFIDFVWKCFLKPRVKFPFYVKVLERTFEAPLFPSSIFYLIMAKS